MLARLLELLRHFIRNGLNLARVGAGADQEEIGEAGHALQIEDANILGLLGFGGMHCGEPEGLRFLQFLRPSQEKYAPAGIVLRRRLRYNRPFMPSLRVLLSSGQIHARILEMAAAIDRDYSGGPVYLIGILKGACIFLADLARAMKTPVRIEFIGIASYGRGKSSSGEVRLTKDLDVSIEGYDVIVVEDIVDSGVTLGYLMKLFQQRRPKSLRVATLLDKPG